MRKITVDLTRPESRRWHAAIARESKSARQIIAGAAREIQANYAMAVAARFLYPIVGGPYRGELNAWARGLTVSQGLLTLLQLSYELSHIGAVVAGSNPLLGCSTGVFRTSAGFTHVRTLDWGIPEMRRASRRIDFIRKNRKIMTVGFPGFIGVLTGMLPGAYSVSINYAPPSGIPGLGASPPLLVRHVLENCDTYESAVKQLSETVLTTNVFFTVCGVDNACVIERERKGYALRPYQKGLVVTNHYVRQPPDGAYGPPEDSYRRYRALRKAIDGDPTNIGARICKAPLTNELTCQRLMLTPSSGALEVI